MLNTSRHAFAGAVAMLCAVQPAPTFSSEVPIPAETLLVEVHVPSPCIACIDWAEHLRKRGLKVRLIETSGPDLEALKRQLGIPEALASRHTAQVAGYFIEGHVPADDILELLRDRPKARGITVPGLPRGAPGLELTNPTCETACTMLDNDSGVRDIKRELFDTLLVLPNGTTKIWARH